MWTRLFGRSRKPRRADQTRLRLEPLEDRWVPGAFTAGNLVIYRVGDGDASLVNTGSAVFLDEYTPDGQYVQSVALPTAADGDNNPLIASGTATSEGLLSLSYDGQYIVLVGYGRAIGGSSSLPSTASTDVPRIIGVVDAAGSVNTTTALSDFANANNPRGVASTDGTEFWVVGGAGGVRYTTLGETTSTQLSTTLTNIRGIEIFDGQLYISTGSGSAVRIGTVGDGIPTTSGNTISNLPGFPTSGSPYGFYFADLSSDVDGLDTLYVADDAANVIQKYSLVSGNWTATGTISATTVRGLTAMVNGTDVLLFATTGSSFYFFNDTTGYNGTASGSVTTIASADTNTAFRGIAFAPNAAPVLTGANNFADISANETDNNGTLVSDLIDGHVTDANANPMLGIAITEVNTKFGTWEYSTDGGTKWEIIDSVSETSALLLKADSMTRVRFVPDADFTGDVSPGITFHAWDQTSGSAGSMVDITVNGAGTAFSSDAATSDISVTDTVPMTPSVTGATTDEDTATGNELVITANENDGGATTHFQITNITGGKLFHKDGATEITSGTFITLDEGAAGLVFLPDEDQNDDTTSFFGFDVQAATGDTDDALAGSTVTATVNVNPINDAPIFNLVTTDITVDENSGEYSEDGFAFDIAAGPATATDELATQTLEFEVTNDNNDLFSAQPTIDASEKLTFTPADNAFGTATVTVKLIDSGSNETPNVNNSTLQFTITVNEVTANSPTVTDATTAEDTQTTSGLVVSRNAADGAEVSHFQVTNIQNGTVALLDGTVVNNGDFIAFGGDGTTQLRFTPNQDQNDDTTSFFGFDVQAATGETDDALAGSTVTATVNVNPINDAPIFNLVTTDVTVDENSGEYSEDGFAFDIAAGPATATDELATQTLEFEVTNDNNDLFSAQPTIDASGKLTFTPADNAFGTATVTVKLIDSGSNETPNVNNSILQFTITVNAIANSPSVTDATTAEDTQTTSGLVVSRNAADGAEVTHFQVTNIQNGTVTLLDGTVINNGDFIAFGGDGTTQLRFTPNQDQNDDTTSFFGFDVQASLSADAGGLGGQKATATVNVTPVNDAPTFDLGADVVINEDAGPQLITGFASNFLPGPVTATDEATQTVASYNVTVTGTTGNLVFSQAPAIDTNGNLTFTVAQDTNGTATIEVTVTDSGSGVAPNVNTSSAKTFNITVNAVNDQPSVFLAGSVVTVNQNSGVFNQTNFAAFNPGGGSDEAGQTPTYIVLNTNNTLFSIQPTINAAGTLTFAPAPGVFGSAIVTVRVQDSGGTLNGGINLSEPVQFTINVNEMIVITPPPPPQINPGASAQFLVIGSDIGELARVRVIDLQGGVVASEIVPFVGYAGGVKVAVGDVTGDGVDNIIVATATSSSHVKVFDARTGAELISFLAFPGYNGGLTLAVGDVNRDGIADIIVGTATGASHVMVVSGKSGQVLQSFIAFNGFSGGVRVAAGDVNGDGNIDIGVVAGPGGNGHIKVFDGATGENTSSFLAYIGHLGEINIAMGDLTGDGKAEIITVAQNPTNGAHVMAFAPDASIVRSFFAPTSMGTMIGFQRADGSVITPNQAPRIAAADVNGDQIADILLGDPPGTGASKLLLIDGATGGIIQQDFAFDPLFGLGVYVDM